MKNMNKISIIVPAYNEEESLPYLFDRLNNLMDSNKNYEFEIFGGIFGIKTYY